MPRAGAPGTGSSPGYGDAGDSDDGGGGGGGDGGYRPPYTNDDAPPTNRFQDAINRIKQRFDDATGNRPPPGEGTGDEYAPPSTDDIGPNPPGGGGGGTPGYGDGGGTPPGVTTPGGGRPPATPGGGFTTTQTTRTVQPSAVDAPATTTLPNVDRGQPATPGEGGFTTPQTTTTVDADEIPTVADRTVDEQVDVTDIQVTISEDMQNAPGFGVTWGRDEVEQATADLANEYPGLDPDEVDITIRDGALVARATMEGKKDILAYRTLQRNPNLDAEDIVVVQNPGGGFDVKLSPFYEPAQELVEQQRDVVESKLQAVLDLAAQEARGAFTSPSRQVERAVRRIQEREQQGDFDVGTAPPADELTPDLGLSVAPGIVESAIEAGAPLVDVSVSKTPGYTAEIQRRDRGDFDLSAGLFGRGDEIESALDAFGEEGTAFIRQFTDPAQDYISSLEQGLQRSAGDIDSEFVAGQTRALAADLRAANQAIDVFEQIPQGPSETVELLEAVNFALEPFDEKGIAAPPGELILDAATGEFEQTEAQERFELAMTAGEELSRETLEFIEENPARALGAGTAAAGLALAGGAASGRVLGSVRRGADVDVNVDADTGVPLSTRIRSQAGSLTDRGPSVDLTRDPDAPLVDVDPYTRESVSRILSGDLDLPDAFTPNLRSRIDVSDLGLAEFVEDTRTGATPSQAFPDFNADLPESLDLRAGARPTNDIEDVFGEVQATARGDLFEASLRTQAARGRLGQLPRDIALEARRLERRAGELPGDVELTLRRAAAPLADAAPTSRPSIDLSSVSIPELNILGFGARPADNLIESFGEVQATARGDLFRRSLQAQAARERLGQLPGELAQEGQRGARRLEELPSDIEFTLRQAGAPLAEFAEDTRTGRVPLTPPTFEAFDRGVADSLRSLTDVTVRVGPTRPPRRDALRVTDDELGDAGVGVAAADDIADAIDDAERAVDDITTREGGDGGDDTVTGATSGDGPTGVTIEKVRRDLADDFDADVGADAGTAVFGASVTAPAFTPEFDASSFAGGDVTVSEVAGEEPDAGTEVSVGFDVGAGAGVDADSTVTRFPGFDLGGGTDLDLFTPTDTDTITPTDTDLFTPTDTDLFTPTDVDTPVVRQPRTPDPSLPFPESDRRDAGRLPELVAEDEIFSTGIADVEDLIDETDSAFDADFFEGVNDELGL